MNTVEEYISAQAAEAQPLLREIRDCIRSAIPEAEEVISWAMPTFRRGRNIIHFAAFKRHIGIYPGPEAVEVFSERLTGYKTSKGAVQLPMDRELPLELIAEMAKWCYDKYAAE